MRLSVRNGCTQLIEKSDRNRTLHKIRNEATRKKNYIINDHYSMQRMYGRLCQINL